MFNTLSQFFRRMRTLPALSGLSATVAARLPDDISPKEVPALLEDVNQEVLRLAWSQGAAKTLAGWGTNADLLLMDILEFSEQVGEVLRVRWYREYYLPFVLICDNEILNAILTKLADAGNSEDTTQNLGEDLPQIVGAAMTKMQNVLGATWDRAK